MDYTKNLKLSKPSYEDDVDIQILNNNSDILDEKIKELLDRKVDLSEYVKHPELEPYALKKDYLPLTGGNLTGDLTIKGQPIMYVVAQWFSEDKSNYWIKYSDGTLVQQVSQLTTAQASGTIDYSNITLLTPYVDANYHVSILSEANKPTTPINSVLYSNTIQGRYSTPHTSNFVLKSTTRFCCTTVSNQSIIVFVIGRWK